MKSNFQIFTRYIFFGIVLLSISNTTVCFVRDDESVKQNSTIVRGCHKKCKKKRKKHCNKPKPFDPISGFVPCGNANLFYTIQGSGPQTIVLLHGYVTDHKSWVCQAPLANQFRLLELDLRGFGQSSKEGPFTAVQYANDVKCVLDFLNIQSPILLGFSMGGVIAIKFASLFPDRISKLILTNTGPRVFNKNCVAGIPVGPDAWCFGLDPALFPGLIATVKTNVDAGFLIIAAIALKLEICPQVASLVTGLGLPSTITNGATAAAVADALWNPANPATDLRNDLKKIKVPTLILGGCNDGLFTPPVQTFMRNQIPNSKLVMFGRSHDIPLLDVTKFNQLVTNFANNQPITEVPASSCGLVNAPCDTCLPLI